MSRPLASKPEMILREFQLMTEALIILLSYAPIVQVPQPVFDTALEMSVHLHGGFQSPNRDLRAGFEFGGKLEYLLVHPYIVRLGLDYSEADITDPFVPSGRKKSWTVSADGLVYIGQDGVISYLGLGLTYGINSIKASQSARDSLLAELGVTDISISDKFGYRIFLGLRFQERYVIEMAFQQSNPDYLYRRQLDSQSYGLTRIKGSFSVARITFGYLVEI